MKGADGVNWVGMKRRKPSYAWLTANDASPESQSDKVELGCFNQRHGPDRALIRKAPPPRGGIREEGTCRPGAEAPGYSDFARSGRRIRDQLALHYTGH